MPARARKTTTGTEPKLIDVTGVEVTAEQIRQAIDILTSASGIMVAQPLRTAGHPLAQADYHKLAAEQRGIDLDPGARTKPMFISALERLAAGG